MQLAQPEIRQDKPVLSVSVAPLVPVTCRSSIDQRMFLMCTIAPFQLIAGSSLSVIWLPPVLCASTNE